MSFSARTLWLLWPAAFGLVIVWLLDIGGPGLPLALRGAAAGVTVAVILTTLAGRGVAVALGEPSPERTASRWMIALLVLGLVVRFVGLDFELVDHPRSDEGVYLAASQRINDGDLFPETFNYGHFLYYAGALALWVEEALPAVVPPLVTAVYGVETPFEIDRIMLKGICALLGALTVGAVFSIGRRTAGLTAGVLSGLLIAFSPIYNDISHQLISDVPSGYFAALCMVFVARLTEREATRDYLLAGVAAGLAAGSKYPGGVVAIAIFSVWLYWRWRERGWSWALLWSALASIGAMLAVMPSLIFAREGAFSGRGLDIFFGFRQYAFGGWLGVQPESAVVWYGSRLLASFGLIAVAFGIGGLFMVNREARKRMVLLLPFPLAYLMLISAMSMVVERNLQPVLPMLAVILGVGVVGWQGLIRSWGPRRRSVSMTKRLLAALLALAALLVPAAKTIAWDYSRTRDGTRQIARQWIENNLPDGISILRESYTSQLDLERYHVQRLRFAAWMPDEQLFSPRWDYLLLARNAHGRFLKPEALTRDHEREYAERYRKILETQELVAEWVPGPLRAGAELKLFRVTPLPPTYLEGQAFTAADATYISDGALRRLGPEGPITYTRRWQYAVFKDYFDAGTYRVTLDVDREPDEGYLYVVTPDNREIGTWDASSSFEVELPEQGKYLFRVFLAPPTRLAGWSVSLAGPAEAKSEGDHR